MAENDDIEALVAEVEEALFTRRGPPPRRRTEVPYTSPKVEEALKRMKRPQVCPVLRWEVEDIVEPGEEGEPGERVIEAFGYHPHFKHPVAQGHMVDDTDPRDDKDAFAMSWSGVYAPLRRCGYGTQLYEKLRDEACKRERRLLSDTTRLKPGEGFWRKQVRKKRAECVLWWGDGECRQYGMKTKCPRDRSLAGRKKRKKR